MRRRQFTTLVLVTGYKGIGTQCVRRQCGTSVVVTGYEGRVTTLQREKTICYLGGDWVQPRVTCSMNPSPHLGLGSRWGHLAVLHMGVVHTLPQCMVYSRCFCFPRNGSSVDPGWKRRPRGQQTGVSPGLRGGDSNKSSDSPLTLRSPVCKSGRASNRRVRHSNSSKFVPGLGSLAEGADQASGLPTCSPGEPP